MLDTISKGLIQYAWVQPNICNLTALLLKIAKICSIKHIIHLISLAILMFENRLCLGMRETAVFKYPGHMSQEENGTDAKLGYSL